MTNDKYLLVELSDTGLGGHPYDHALAHSRFLKEVDIEQAFVLESGGDNLADSLRQSEVKYHKISLPRFNRKSKIPQYFKSVASFLFDIIRFIKVFQIAERSNVKLVNILSFATYDAITLFFSMLYHKSKIPLIITIHNFSVDDKVTHNIKKFLSNRFAILSIMILRHLIEINRIQKIVVCADSIKSFLSKYIPSDKILKTPLPIAFDYENFKYSNEYSREILELPKEAPLLLAFSPDSKGKSIDNLLKALPYIKGNYKLVLVGHLSTSFNDKTSNVIGTLNLKNKIILRNKFVDTKEKFHYFNSADLIIQPYISAVYKKSRTASTVLTECIIFKKPVIITDIGESSDLVEKNKLGVIVNDNVTSWSNTLNHSLENLDKLTDSARENANKLLDSYRYDTILKRVYNR